MKELCAEVMPMEALQLKFVKEERRLAVINVFTLKKYLNSSSVKHVVILFVQDVVKNIIILHNVMMEKTGEESVKIRQTLQIIQIIESVLIVRKQYKDNQVVILWFAHVSKLFAIFADRNGCQIIISMESVIDRQK